MILTYSSQNHQYAQVYTTALQALFLRIYWIFFDIPARKKLHYNTTGDFNMLISRPSDTQGLHYNSTEIIFAHILDFFYIPVRAKLHYNTTGDFNMLISKPSDAQSLHYNTTEIIFTHILNFFQYSCARKFTLQHYRRF